MEIITAATEAETAKLESRKRRLLAENKAKMEAAGITTMRTAKDITNKISALESLFRNAEDWRNSSGQGLRFNEPSIREALLLRYSFYFELRAVMLYRASTHPQLLNTDAAASKDDTEDDSASSSEYEPSGSEDSDGSTDRASSAPISIARRPPKRQCKRYNAELGPLMKFKEGQLAQSCEPHLLELEVRKRGLTTRTRNGSSTATGGERCAVCKRSC